MITGPLKGSDLEWKEEQIRRNIEEYRKERRRFVASLIVVAIIVGGSAAYVLIQILWPMLAAFLKANGVKGL